MNKLEKVSENILNIVNNCEIIDIHSHLFPVSHGELFLFGINNLLTYHYLIAELFIFWNEMKINDFYDLEIKKQADIIWKELFIKRSPISEACQGILTTCKLLGLHNEIN